MHTQGRRWWDKKHGAKGMGGVWGGQMKMHQQGKNKHTANHSHIANDNRVPSKEKGMDV